MRDIMRYRTLVAVAAILSGAIATPLATTAWPIDPSRSEVRFTVTKLGFEDVTGVFRESEGEIEYDPNRPEASRVRWRVRVASVLTDASNRDKSLQQAEYFDAEHHPYLEFVSQAVRPLGPGRIEVSGPITIRGVSRPVTFVARVVKGDPLPRFETDFTVDRYDFGVIGGTFFGRLIGRTVRVHLVAGVRANGGRS
jgi:polyisoprenoid-binding protein YceI